MRPLTIAAADPAGPGRSAKGHWAARRRPASAIGIAASVVPTAIAAGLVLHGLGTRSIWLDEGTTIAIARQHGVALWHSILQDGGNMAAYYGVMHLFVRMFGSGIIAVRLPSALAVVATVALTQRLSRRLFGPRAAYACSLAAATSLPMIYWGQQARGYALAVFLLTAAASCLVAAIQHGNRVAWCGGVLLSALAIYTTLLSAFVLGAILCSLVFLTPAAVPVRRLAVACGATIVLCSPLAVVVASHGAAQLSWVPPITVASVGSAWQFVASATVVGTRSSASTPFLFLGTLVAWAAAVLVLFGLARRRGRSMETWSLALVVCWLLLPLALTFSLSALGWPILVERYLLVTLPAGSMLLGYAISRARPVPYALLAGLILIALRSIQISPSYGQPVEDWRAAAGFVLARSGPDDCMAFFESDGYLSFRYYVPTTGLSRLRVVLPADTSSTNEPFLLSIRVRELPGLSASCPTLWLVTTHVGSAPGPAATPFQKRRYATYTALVSGLGRYYRVVLAKDFVGVGVKRLIR